ncbi:Na(+)/H(+) antiporter subunit C [Nocardia sp. 348MFTsu5.1]|uniref:Na(+)/H(+) antiporter subunit C n=1 Tax=Nocardia sp. 348MFTsu5.1 TaxID=1172185 RepID=UPI00036B73F0|nr:Na(+)/H(+) antiporter subunit C [Nocardia sp. 348MFTsu5.1]
MSVNLGLLIVVGLMAACGVYLLLERSLVKMLLGLLLVGNAINLMIITLSGAMGNPPIVGRNSEDRTSDADPLAQGMILTAIVITMGMAAFILSLAYRSFMINTDDEVDDDPEDLKVQHQRSADAPDRDRSDDPVTGSDTKRGDMFDDDGNPLTEEQIKARRAEIYETDILPDPDDLDDEFVEELEETVPDIRGGSDT